MRHRRSIGLSIAVVLGLVPGVVSAATVRVDDDGKASATSCTATTTAPKTVQAGVKAAGKNGTVILCPGTYKGNVVIDGTRDGVTIQGAASFKSKLLPPVAGGGNPIIWIKSSADTVTLKGLLLSAPASDCTVDAMIKINGRGIKVLGNHLLPASCVNRGIAVNPDGDVEASATIKNNLIAKYQRMGIEAYGELATVTISKNTIRYDLDYTTSNEPTGIGVSGHVNGSVTGNTIIQGSGEAQPDHGIEAAYGESLLVDGNTITGAGTGIYLTFVQLMTVTNNTITGTGTGILTEAFTNSTVQGNTLSQHVYGIRSSDSIGNEDGNNLFKANVVTQSSEWGCLEEVPDIDGHPANTWEGNSSDSASTVGSGVICPAD